MISELVRLTGKDEEYIKEHYTEKDYWERAAFEGHRHYTPKK